MKDSSIIPDQIKQFNELAAKWWQENGPMKALHQMNPTRLKFIQSEVMRHFKITESRSVLTGKTVLDVGCGAGLLTEPLRRMGGDVTGIDAGSDVLDAARRHAKDGNLEIDYVQTTIEDHAKEGLKYDIVTALEIVEHVQDPEKFIRACSGCLKKDGILFISTLNRTFESKLLAIGVAEYVLKLAPAGTHSWEKFLKPHEIEKTLRQEGYGFENLKGLVYHPLKGDWSLSPNLSVNYIGSCVAQDGI